MLQALQALSAAGLLVVVTRVAGTRGQGVFVLLVTISVLVTAATSLGIGTAAAHYLGAGRYSAAQAVPTVLTLGVLSALSALVVTSLAYRILADSYFADVTLGQFGILLALIPPAQVTATCASILLGSNQPLRYATLLPVQASLALAIALGLAAAHRLDSTSALMGWGTGVAFSAILGLVWVGQVTRIRLELDRALAKKLVSYGLKTHVANLATFFNYRLDALIINGLSGAATLGVYMVAVYVAESIWYPASAISVVLFPRASALPRRQASVMTAMAARNTFLVSALGCVGLYLLGPSIVQLLFTQALQAAVQPLRLLLPGVLALAGAKVISSYLNGIGRPIYGAYVAPISLALTVLLDILLIPPMGASGAAIASSCVYIFGTLLALRFFVKESGLPLRASLVIQAEDLAAYQRLFRRGGSLVGRIPLALRGRSLGWIRR